jgi:hypothetical protein
MLKEVVQSFLFGSEPMSFVKLLHMPDTSDCEGS